MENIFDFDIDAENNKNIFNTSVINDMETVTDLELFKVYTILNIINLDLNIDTPQKMT